MNEKSLIESIKHHQRNVLFSAVIIILAGGSIFYHLVEKWSWLDSIYFCVVTTATVGYGDFTPTKPISKIFTIFYIMLSITIVLGALNYLMRERAARFKIKQSEKIIKKFKKQD